MMKDSGKHNQQQIPLLQLAIAHHKSGHTTEAETCYREILRVSPQHPDANHNLGVLLASSNTPQASLAFFKRALSSSPANPQFWTSLISTLTKLRRHEEAVATLTQAGNHLPEQAFSKLAMQQCLKIALGYSQKKDWAGTINAAQRGLKYAADDAQLWHCLGYGQLQLCHYEKAINALSKSVQLVNDARTWNHLGVAHLSLKAHDKARTAFENSIKLDPQLSITWSNAASNEYKTGNFKQAAIYAERALTLDPASEKAQLIQGMVALKYGQLDECRKMLQLAITSATQQTQTLYIPEPSYISTSDARIALIDAHQCFSQAGIPFFLCAGTLLGIIRGGDILAFDKDMDVGVPAQVNRELALAALTSSNKFKLNNPDLATQNSWKWNFSAVHIETNIALDLFFYHPDDEHFLCGFDAQPHPVLSRPRKFPLEILRWQNLEWQIPSPPEQYLSDIYGANWHIPDPGFDTVISSHCQTPESRPVRCCFGYVKLYDALTKQKWRKAYSYCAQILQLDKDMFIETIQQWLLKNHTDELDVVLAATDAALVPQA